MAKFMQPPVQNVMEYTCDKCKRVFNRADNFYKSHSNVYNNNGCMPICKDCLTDLFNRYYIAYQDSRKAIKRICMLYDLYYSDAIANTICLDTENAPQIGNYIKKLNLAHVRQKTFDNTIEEGFSFDSTIVEFEDTVTKTAKSVVDRWGSGFSAEEYQTLENHYKYLKKANPNCDENQEIFIIDLCYIKMQQMNAMRTRSTDDFNKLSESYRKTFTQAGLKTVRETTNEDAFSFGVTAQMIEQYTPAEYYANQDHYKDFDGIGDYIKRFMMRPLKNLMTGSSDRDEEYCVKDEEEDELDELDDE